MNVQISNVVYQQKLVIPKYANMAYNSTYGKMNVGTTIARIFFLIDVSLRNFFKPHAFTSTHFQYEIVTRILLDRIKKSRSNYIFSQTKFHLHQRMISHLWPHIIYSETINVVVINSFCFGFQEIVILFCSVRPYCDATVECDDTDSINVAKRCLTFPCTNSAANKRQCCECKYIFDVIFLYSTPSESRLVNISKATLW